MINTVCAQVDCGVEFSLPDHIWNQVRHIGMDRWVYCPNGHQFRWLKSEAEELKERVSALEKQVRRRDEIIASNEDSFARWRRSVSYWKGIAHRGRK